MMRSYSLAVVITVTFLSLSACRGGDAAEEESAQSSARDSALAADLKLAAADSSAPGSEGALTATTRSDSVPAMVDDARPRASREVAPAPSTVSPPRRTVTQSPGSVAPSPAPAAASVPARAGASSVAPTSATTSSVRTVPAAGYPGAACASPATSDQRRCLTSYLARSDASLDRTYQALIARLKREAGTRPGGAEPPAVQQLRATQRAWVDYRDVQCQERNRGKEGPLWAPARAKCLASYSTVRVNELAKTLATHRRR